MQTILQIPTPCHEKWSEMAPVRHDCRHCAACEKQIMDFTMKTDAEILEHLRRNQGKVCGKFRPDQLERPLMTPRAVKRGGFSAIAASFAAALSAQQPVNQTIEPFITEQVPTDVDRTTLGKVAYHNFLEPDSMRTISGKVIDSSGEGLIGATIKLSLGEDFYRGAITDYNGYFRIRIPPVNELQQKQDIPWNLEVHYTGFKTKSQTLPKAINFGDIDIPILMEARPEIGEPEIVAYKVPLIEQDGSIMGVTLTSDEIKNLPRRAINTVVPTAVGAESVDGLQPADKTTLKFRTRHFFRRLFHG